MADSRSLSDVLFRKKRLEVLELLIDSPGKSFTASEIEDNVDSSRPTVLSVIEDLSEAGIVDRRKKGGQYSISINEKSPYYQPLMDILEVDSEPLVELADRFADGLFQRFEGVVSVYLFGSVARGTTGFSSDIDLLVVLSEEEGEGLEEDIKAFRDGFQKDKDVRLSITFYTRKELERDVERGIELVNNIEEEGIHLGGEEIW